MAFQVGTQIRPELADADYSGFVNAANIQAQAMMNLGEQIGGGIEKYQKNKQITAASLGSFEGKTVKNPELVAILEQMDGEVGKAYKEVTGGKYNMNNVSILNNFATTYVEEKQRQNQVRRAALEEQLMQQQLRQGGSTAQRNLQAPKTYTTPTGDNVYGAFNPSTGQLEEVGTGRELPPGSLPFSGEGEPTKGQIMTIDQLNALRNQGTDYTATPLGDGQYLVTSMSPFSPRNEDDSDPFMEAAQKKAGEAFGTSVTEWQSGGSLQARNQLRSLQSAFNALAAGSADTRTFVEFVPNIGGFRDSARGLFNPTGQEAYDNVVSVVSTTLREALGSQFTEKEGTRILNASYNPQLTPEQNLEKLAGIAGTLSATIEAKDAQAAAFRAGEDWRSLPSPKEVFETNLALYEKVLQDQDRAMGISPTGENQPATRIKRIKSTK